MTINKTTNQFEFTASAKHSLANLFGTPVAADLMAFSSDESKRYNKTVKGNIEWMVEAILDIVGITPDELMHSPSLHYANINPFLLAEHISEVDLERDMYLEGLSDDQLAFATSEAFRQFFFAYSEGALGWNRDMTPIIGKPTPASASHARELVDAIINLLANAAFSDQINAIPSEH